MARRVEGESIAKGVPGALGNVADGITAASRGAFGAFFFLNSGKEIWGWQCRGFQTTSALEVDDCGQAAWVTLSGYTRGIILIAIADGLLVGIGLQILHVPLAPRWRLSSCSVRSSQSLGHPSPHSLPPLSHRDARSHQQHCSSSL